MATYKEAKAREIDTPTKERFDRGELKFEQVKEKEAKVLKAIDPTPFHKAHAKGKLTDKQLAAAEWFEKSYGIIYSGLVGGRRDPLDMTPRGAPANGDATPNYINLKNMLEKVQGRLLLETLAEFEVRTRKLSPKRRLQMPLLKVGKWGEQRYMTIRSVCAHHGTIGKIEKTRRRYQLLCEGLDIIHDVVF